MTKTSTKDGRRSALPILLSRKYRKRLPSRVPKARNDLRTGGIAEDFAASATDPRRRKLPRRPHSAFKLAFAIVFTYKLEPE
jgi:hypothetical protein